MHLFFLLFLHGDAHASDAMNLSVLSYTRAEFFSKNFRENHCSRGTVCVTPKITVMVQMHGIFHKDVPATCIVDYLIVKLFSF